MKEEGVDNMSIESILETGKAALGKIATSGLTDGARQKYQAGIDRVKNSKLLASTGIPLVTLSDKDSYKDKNNNKIFDVVNDYPWTVTSKGNRRNVPYIKLTEYEQDVSTLYAQLAYWSNSLKVSDDNPVNPYQNLYHALPTGTQFIFPYFEEYDHQIGQTWEKTKGAADFAIVDKLLNIVGNIAKMTQAAPGTNINQPQTWTGSQANTYTISFRLFNTVQEGDIAKNQAFKRRIQMSTLHDQRSAILSSPSAIFEVDIPGIRYHCGR